MQKIIKGLRYDTEKAEHVGQWDNGYTPRDFQWCEENLYLTTKGNWFLHGEGGPMSKYTRHQGNDSIGGEDLVPFTPDQAKGWLEQHNFVAALETYFPDEIEDA